MEEKYKETVQDNGNETVAPAPAPAPPARAPNEEVHKENEALDASTPSAVLAKVATKKRLALIKAWEDSEKSKAENKAYKRLSSIESWENSKKASVEAHLKKIEEKLEKKKARYAELMRNKIAELHKEAEERRAMVEAKKGEAYVKIEETAAKCRASGSYAPKKCLGCFSA